MKILVESEKSEIWGIFQCIECSSILEVDMWDKITTKYNDNTGIGPIEGFNCPLCKKFNPIGEAIDVNFLLTMRAIRDEISSEQIVLYPIFPNRREEYHVYYKDIYIGQIYYLRQHRRAIDKPIEKIHIIYNDLRIFICDDISDSSDHYLEKAKEIFVNKIKETNPYVEKYALLLKDKEDKLVMENLLAGFRLPDPPVDFTHLLDNCMPQQLAVTDQEIVVKPRFQFQVTIGKYLKQFQLHNIRALDISSGDITDLSQIISKLESMPLLEVLDCSFSKLPVGCQHDIHKALVHVAKNNGAVVIFGNASLTSTKESAIWFANLISEDEKLFARLIWLEKSDLYLHFWHKQVPSVNHATRILSAHRAFYERTNELSSEPSRIADKMQLFPCSAYYIKLRDEWKL